MADKLLKRSEVKTEDTWRLEDIYETEELWEGDFETVKNEIPKLAAYAGTLSNKDSLKEMLDLLYKAERKLTGLFAYARMRRDEDNAVTRYQGMVARTQSLITQFSAAMAFAAPELLSAEKEYLDNVKNDPAFSDYDMFIDDLIRRRPHTLSANEEKLIAMTGEMGSAPQTIYGMLTSADMRFPEIEDENGEKIRVTQSNYIPLVMSRSEKVRKAAFDALYSTYMSYSATIPAIYSASVSKDVFYARSANYKSALVSQLYPDNVPESVYENLILAINENLSSLQRFVGVNGRLNGIDKMHFYDLYLAPELGFDIKLPFSEAYDLVVDCLKVLGEDYQAVLKKAKDERWIDPYENEGKSSGAYSWGTYDSHPYVSINYKEDLDHLQTIAHEMGHSLHTWYSNSQPYPKSDYSLFVAEVASTVNEILVLMELMERHPEKNAQAYLLYSLLDSFRGTVFRQTMFAEFEKISHEMCENGQPLTVESLNGAYAELNKKYYANIEFDELISAEWMRIPHFYRSFYVYKYATGFSAAMAIAGMIRKEGKTAVERYKSFLKAGGSLYPIDALKLAGIDMSSPEPVRRAMAEFNELLRKYEEVTKDM
ncbi:MAG: oligoendopeptidase F [Clostridia bacterium]|nr:oligoendopeptidase F [Clostridia bacterium]MBQ4158190.1 oligoendopeptidase F [Clostridia bacterium]